MCVLSPSFAGNALCTFCHPRGAGTTFRWGVTLTGAVVVASELHSTSTSLTLVAIMAHTISLTTPDDAGAFALCRSPRPCGAELPLGNVQQVLNWSLAWSSYS